MPALAHLLKKIKKILMISIYIPLPAPTSPETPALPADSLPLSHQEICMRPNLLGVWQTLDSKPENQGSYFVPIPDGGFLVYVSSLSAKSHGFVICKRDSTILRS